MTDVPESPFARWSRRKLAQQRQDREAAAAQPAADTAASGAEVHAAHSPTDGPWEDRAAVPVSAGPGLAAGDADLTAPAAPRVLPDPGTLTAGSDFSVYLGADVPEAVHRQAMRALWKSNPALGMPDGLTDYDEDYQSGMRFTGVVRTAWRIGKGIAAEASEDDAPPVSADGSADATPPLSSAPDASAPDAGTAHASAAPAGDRSSSAASPDVDDDLAEVAARK